MGINVGRVLESYHSTMPYRLFIMSRPASSRSTDTDHSGLFRLEGMRFEDAPYSAKHCDQCFSLGEFLKKKASLAQSELQQKFLIKTHEKMEAVKEFEMGKYRTEKIGRTLLCHQLTRDINGRGFRTLPREPRNLRAHPDHEFHEEVLNNMLCRSCGIYVKQMQELSELQARIEHVKAWGERSYEATIEQDRVNNEIDDHIHNLLVLVTLVCDNSENEILRHNIRRRGGHQDSVQKNANNAGPRAQWARTLGSVKRKKKTTCSFRSSCCDEPLRIQRTQHASDESIHDNFEQNRAQRIRTEDDGTYLDAPSLQRADTSVDSDLGSLRDAVKELVNIRDNISKRQTTSGESIIGDHSSPSGKSDTGDTLLIEKAEEAAEEFEKKHPKKTEATKSESERRRKSSSLTVRKKLSKEAKEEHSHKKMADGKKSKQGTVGGSKDTQYEKHNLKYSLCQTQKSAYTMDTEPSSPRIVHKKAQGQPARKKASTTSTHFMQVIRRKGS
ncbi:unnamed protein product [Haemonchus placei]|uniref:Protein kinase domain-containing protein n=1 Tax=Haemonchus placei TaxID=6290 RepID=A0A158QRM2_HAEPC|nr:unnamed protein product [Haemonchus placei]